MDATGTAAVAVFKSEGGPVLYGTFFNPWTNHHSSTGTLVVGVVSIILGPHTKGNSRALLITPILNQKN